MRGLRPTSPRTMTQACRVHAGASVAWAPAIAAAAVATVAVGGDGGSCGAGRVRGRSLLALKSTIERPRAGSWLLRQPG